MTVPKDQPLEPFDTWGKMKDTFRDPDPKDQREAFNEWRVEHPHLVLYPDVAWIEGYKAALASAAERERELREVIRMLLNSAMPNEKEHPTMCKAWAEAERVLRTERGGEEKQ